MYPLIRLAGTLLRAKRQPQLDPKTISEISFRCRPWDLDMFLEMNNGRILTLYDLGRFDLLIQQGLDKTLRKKQWGLVVASSTVRYRQRIRLFDKVSLHTQVAGIDERWVYIRQSMWVEGRPTSSALLRTAMTHRGKAIPTDALLEEIGLTHQPPKLDAWEQQWVEVEDQRPWPPLV